MASPGVSGAAYRAMREHMKATLPWLCWRCGLAISRAITEANPRDPKAWTADHVIPREYGGATVLSNMKPAHYGCNSRRGNQTHTVPFSEDW